MPPAARFFLKLGVLGAICAVVFLFVLGVQINRGNGMYPFLMDGDLLITYKLDPYRVGDAVVYRRPDTGARAVARIAALGQNKILITDSGQLLINDYVPDENVFYATKKAEGSDLRYPYQMGADGVFLLNDFRTQTDDSRTFGALTREDLTGKVVYVFRRRGI